MTDTRTLNEAQLNQILQQLEHDGHRIIGPRLDSGSIVFDDIHSLDDCPRGIVDEQAPAHYRAKQTTGREYFGYVVGPQSAKRFLFPPEVRIWKATRDGNWCEIDGYGDPRPIVLFGLRSCDVHAIAIQDRVLLHGPYIDADYAQRRKNLAIIAVHCTRAADNCFCGAMNAGPRATAGFDLALAEVLDGDRHVFLAEAGSDRGRAWLASVDAAPTTEADTRRVEEAIRRTQQITEKRFRADGVQDILTRNFEHPRWNETAGRCLACANCTMVCPTCFCINVEDSTDVTGQQAERTRRWDSCFTSGHSYLHGGSVRLSVKSRYRQWLTHKFSTWIEQFGTTGCVGCGRCITWCPAAIDVTEEITVLRNSGKVS